MKPLIQTALFFIFLFVPDLIFAQEEFDRETNTKVYSQFSPDKIQNVIPEFLPGNLQNSAVHNYITNGNFGEGDINKIPANWILAGALIVLLVGLIFEQIKKIFKKKKKK